MEPRLAVTQGGQEDSPVQGAQHRTSRRPGTTAPHRGLGCGAYHLGLTLGPPLVVTGADLTSLSLHSSVIWNLPRDGGTGRLGRGVARSRCSVDGSLCGAVTPCPTTQGWATLLPCVAEA